MSDTPQIDPNRSESSGANGNHHTNSEDFDWLKWSDQYFIGSIGVIVFITLLLQWGWFQNWGRSQAKIIRPNELKYQYSIDINNATAIEWSQLEGIGEVTAEKILDDLRKNGPFEAIDDIQRVSGIGKITLEKIRPSLRLGKQTQDELSSENAQPTPD